MESIERITVMGAGPGGVAAAVSLARRGFDVTLFNRSMERIRCAKRAGGYEIEGDLGEGFVHLQNITHDPGDSLRTAQLILIAVPAYGQLSMIETASAYLRSDTVLLLLTGSCGSLEGAQLLEKEGHDVRGGLLLGETVTLPQSARFTGPGRVKIVEPSSVRGAAFPGSRTDELVERLHGVVALFARPNVFDPGLNNPNFLIHPAPMLLNYAAVERADGYLSIMNEGMTPGVLRCLDAVDAEKMALCTALGIEPIDIDSLYRELGSGPHVYRVQGEPFGHRDRIWPRYIDEDVPYGTVLMSSLGQQIGVPTPVCDAINDVLSVAEGIDFWKIGRTVEKMGLAGMSVNEMCHFVDTGERPLR